MDLAVYLSNLPIDAVSSFFDNKIANTVANVASMTDGLSQVCYTANAVFGVYLNQYGCKDDDRRIEIFGYCRTAAGYDAAVDAVTVPIMGKSSVYMQLS